MTRHVVIRADASHRIGGGHVMRCLTLANALSAEGWTPAFACNDTASSIVPQLGLKQDVFLAPDDGLDAVALARRWPDGCDMLVVDHYGLDAAFESSCRGWAKKVLVLDDLADRLHDCDVLIDATFQRRAADYTTLVPPGSILLLGSAFALLRPEFAALRAISIERRAGRTEVERVFVSFGFTDLDGITEQAVRLLLALPGRFLIDVVARKSSQSWEWLADLETREPRLTLHDNPPAIASLMAEADFAVGAGGTTSWERCVLGLPTVLLVLAANQRSVAASLEGAGAAIVVASPLSANELSFRNAMDCLVRNRELRLAMSAAAAAIADGAGAERVAHAVHGHGFYPLTDVSLSLKRATLQDSLLIWSWRNDVESRANSVNTRPVSWAEHSKWFALALNDPGKVILVASMAGDRYGMVRFDQIDETKVLISVVVAPHRRGGGFGTRLLKRACAMITQEMPADEIRAEIKIANAASRHAFEACGFVLVGSDGAMRSYSLKVMPDAAMSSDLAAASDRNAEPVAPSRDGRTDGSFATFRRVAS